MNDSKTPKEQAEEIFNGFYVILFDSDSDKGEEILVSILAKKCAIKAVNVFIEEGSLKIWTKQFWNEVKEELEKM